jgi:hypothetical protein
VVDITPKSTVFNGGGSISVFGGSQGTISPTFEYGGTAGRTEYYVLADGLATNEGIENADGGYNPIHDHSNQGKFSGDATTYLSDGSRLLIMSGASVGTYQIPNSPRQPIVNPVSGAIPIASSQVNENQSEQAHLSFDANVPALGVIERGERIGLPKLAVVQQTGRDFVIGVQPGFQPGRELLIDPEIKDIGSFRLDWIVEGDLRLLGCAIKGGDVDWS